MASATANNIESNRSFEDDIPVFDLSQLPQKLEEGSTEDLESVFGNVRKACEEWGCFQVVGHGIEHKLLREVEAASRDLFRLPKETKQRNVSATPFYGYIGSSPTIPFYESLGIPGAPLLEAIQRFSDQLWPLHGNPSFCETIQAYSNQMEGLANNIHKIILSSLGINKYYRSHFDDCKGVLRLNRYAVSEESPASYALPAHTDGDSIAIIYEDNVGGLEILSRAGEWVTVKPLANSLVVLIGDSLQAWSNKRCRSVKHRVIVKEWKNRLSLAFFWLFPDEMEISAPPELVDDQHPRCYRSFLYSELTDFRAKGEHRPKIWEASCPADLLAEFHLGNGTKFVSLINF